MSDPFPIVISKSGAQPTPPAALRAALLARVAATNPGYTATLPGSLIEDISSTDVGALAMIDAARVALVNSLTPYGANDFLLTQLGNVYGVPQGVGSNTSVLVVFSGSVGFAVPQGFVVSDGAHQYAVQTGGIIGSSGSSSPIFALATTSGTWAVPANTVTFPITSVPAPITLTVTNPAAGTPGAEAQSSADYRAQVVQAGLAIATGMPTMLRTLLENVPGVQPRLISIRGGATSGTWEILVGGGDPYEVAYAIFSAVFDVTTLAGSASDPTRDVSVSILDFPDTYQVRYVAPRQQAVAMTVSWNSTSPNVVSQAAVAQVASAELAAYVNSIFVGQPINLFELQATFQAAASPLIPAALLTRMEFAVTIDGNPVAPEPGTGIIAGDPEGYFLTDPTQITVTQG